MNAPRITVGVDGSESGIEALTWAFDYALATDAEVDVVTVFHYEGPDNPHHVPSQRASRRSHEAQEQQRRAIDAVLATMPHPPALRRWVVPARSTEHGLVEAATNSDLLVLGSHGHGRFETALLGTVASGCIRWSNCPVVVVPASWSRASTTATTTLATGQPIEQR